MTHKMKKKAQFAGTSLDDNLQGWKHMDAPGLPRAFTTEEALRPREKAEKPKLPEPVKAVAVTIDTVKKLEDGPKKKKLQPE